MVNCGAIIQEAATLSSNEIQMTFRNRFTMQPYFVYNKCQAYH